MARLMSSTAGTIHLTLDDKTQACGMSRRQNYTLCNIPETFDWDTYSITNCPSLYCRRCRAMNGWDGAYQDAAGLEIPEA